MIIPCYVTDMDRVVVNLTQQQSNSYYNWTTVFAYLDRDANHCYQGSKQWRATVLYLWFKKTVCN